MGATQNLLYAIAQAVHNLGAVATVGGAVGGALLRHPPFRRRLARIALAGWVIQAMSGAALGTISWFFEGKLPDIGGVAVSALEVKVVCALIGFIWLSSWLLSGERWSSAARRATWLVVPLLAITALCAAAVLRWYS